MSSILRHVSATFQNIFKIYLIDFFSSILKTFQNKTLPTKLTIDGDPVVEEYSMFERVMYFSVFYFLFFAN